MSPDAPRDDAPRTDPPASLTHRWWWQGAVVVVAGIVVITFQWEVIGSGRANAANWVMVAAGVGAIGFGLVELARARARHQAARDDVAEHDDA